MRYYDIIVTQPGSTTPFRRWTSHPNGNYDPAALDIEFDMPVAPYHTPVGGQTLTIHGISLQEISQAQQFAGMNIVIYGGMKKGLPLANPLQAGLLLQGQIFQSYGNWEGTEMTLEFVINPADYTLDTPGNFLLNWPAGRALSDALTEMFSITYPGRPVSINIGSNLKCSSDEHHIVTTLEEMAMHVADFTDGIFQQPVTIAIQGNKIIVYDKTYQPAPIQVAFNDMIGQPTWIATKTMQVKTVLRSDLEVGATIKMPQSMQNAPGFVQTTGSAYPSSVKYQSTFQNNFTISELRHVGSYRSSDASAWCTVFNCVEGGPQG